MQHWARRLEQEIDGVMRIFGGVQQLREVSLVRLLSCGDLLPSRNEEGVHNERERKKVTLLKSWHSEALPDLR